MTNPQEPNSDESNVESPLGAPNSSSYPPPAVDPAQQHTDAFPPPPPPPPPNAPQPNAVQPYAPQPWGQQQYGQQQYGQQQYGQQQYGYGQSQFQQYATAPYAPGAITKDDMNMGMIAHIVVMFGGVIVSAILYFVMTDKSPFVKHHFRESLNFGITIMIAFFVCFVLCFVLVGFILIPFLVVAAYGLPIMAAIAANRGEWYEYPLIIRFVN